MPTVHLLDYVAGNIRSLANAIEKVGYTVQWIQSPSDVEKVDVGFRLAVLRIDTSLTPLFDARNSFFQVWGTLVIV
jgi:hypothetical protein